MTQSETYKERSIKLIQKTNNPISPIALRQFQNGVEQWARVIAPIADETRVAEYQAHLLEHYSNEELDIIAKEPSFILALLAMVKQSTIDFEYSL